MRILFFKLYIGLLLSTAVIITVLWLIYQTLNDWRLKQFLINQSHATIELISQGAQRHQGESRQQWLALVSTMANMDIALQPRKKITRQDRYQFTHQILSILVPLSSEHELAIQWREIDEPLAFAIATLIKNEFGLRKNESPRYLASLQKSFDFSIIQKHYKTLALSQSELKQLNIQGFLNTHSPQLIHYSRIANSDQVLVLGEIEAFNQHHSGIVIGFILLSLICIILSVFLQLTPLQTRLNRLARAVSQVGNRADSIDIAEHGKDGLAVLSQQIEQMASRIHTLLVQQKELTQAVSHEFRTPLARMNYRLQLLQDDFPENNKRIDGLNKDISQLGSLVDELLTYHHLENDSSRFEFTFFNLYQASHALIMDLQPLSHQQITLHCDHSLLLLGDQYYLTRGLQNIITNAQRYARTQIIISVEKTDDLINIHIDNDGDKISDQDKQTILAPFKVVDKSRNKKTGGHGLGLAITQSILKQHYGDLTISDANIGGARFTLSVPIKTP